MMNYREALDYIRSAESLGCTPGLSRIQELLKKLGNPQDQLRCIHIAGTNGKGSVAAMLSSVLTSAGYRVGVFSSPHLLRYNERIQVDGAPIPDADFAELTSVIKEAADGMQETASEFERFTPMAFLYFLRKHCDLAIIECGMGGRLDATNVIDRPLLSLITHIALDHMEFLGETEEEIALEKAGIIKSGCPVVLMRQKASVEAVIRAQSEKLDAALSFTAPDQLRIRESSLAGQRFDYRGRTDLYLSLSAVYQQRNVQLVLDAIDRLNALGYTVDDRAVRDGLKNAQWPGRFECLKKEPLVLIDGAHNEDGVQALVESLKAHLPGTRFLFVMGVLADKPYRQMIRLLAPIASRFVAARPANSRALPEDALKAAIREESGKEVILGGPIKESCDLALSIRRDDEAVCILGSLYQAGEARSYFEKQ